MIIYKPIAPSPDAHTQLPDLRKPADTLLAMIDRATRALEDAKTSAEVLDARDMARVAYDAAKSAGRLAKAKQAHATIVAHVHRAQADALLIESRAKIRLAEEYDAAQERGEVQKRGGDGSSKAELPTASDVGLTRKEIHEAREIRDAEAADPGIVQRVLNEQLESGREPTKAAVKQAIAKPAKPTPVKVMDPKALWIWGRLCEFERDGMLKTDPEYLISEMVDHMREEVKRLAPLVAEFINRLEKVA